MKRINRKYTIRAVLALTLVMVSLSSFSLVSNSASYRRGSSGEEVKTIQTKLKRWGYYEGTIDGIYGGQTVDAVKLFQKKNGLSIDGVCGPATLKALGMTGGSSATSGSGDANSAATAGTSEDLYLLAKMISAESRGEPYIGQVAVGAVILNRVKHPSFPNSISGVLYQPGAFTALADGQFKAEPENNAKKAAQDALNGWDPSGGAIYYYNPDKSTSKWIFTRETIAVIGKHVFAK